MPTTSSNKTHILRASRDPCRPVPGTLLDAAFLGDAALMKSLLESGQDPNDIQPDDITPLHLAISSEH